MSNNTNTKPATRPAVFTKKDWDLKTIRAYNGLIMLVKGELPKGRYSSMTKAYLYHPVVKELFEKCGIPFEEKQVLSLMFFMVREKTAERHIIPVASLRKWFNGGWKVEKPVTYTELKVHASATKTATKSKKNTKSKEDEANEILATLSKMSVDELSAIAGKLMTA